MSFLLKYGQPTVAFFIAIYAWLFRTRKDTRLHTLVAYILGVLSWDTKKQMTHTLPVKRRR
jgi:hypothetical protein